MFRSNVNNQHLWDWKGQTKVPLSLKKVFKVQALRVIIIASQASQAHNLCKSSQGLVFSLRIIPKQNNDFLSIVAPKMFMMK